MQEYIPADKLAHVQRVLYGWNMGKAVAAVPLAPPLAAAAEQAGYDLQAYRFEAAPEQLRPPRIVRVGLVQHSIKLPTTAPFLEQRQVRAAGASGGLCSAAACCKAVQPCWSVSWRDLAVWRACELSAIACTTTTVTLAGHL
jgi:hypothetical protein